MRTVDGYRGIWFELGEKTRYGDKYSGGLGTYTANHTPMAVYAPQVDRTFFTYGGTTGKDQRHLLIMVSYFDHKTGRVPRPVVVHDKVGVNDPHDNAALNVDEAGHIWVFISGRGRRRPGFIYRSRKPHDITDFERIREAEMTYPQPHFVPGRGWLHLMTKYTGRTGGRQLYWQTSKDGRTWSDDQMLGGMDGHYQVSSRREGTVGTFFNYHPGGVVNKRTNLYYAQTRDFGQTWTTVDGQALTLPLREARNAALVVDYAAQGKLMYTCDLNWDKAGQPLMLYVTSHDAAPGPQGEPREVCLTRWDGTQWQTHVITRTDHNYDMGSLWVDGDEWTVVFPTQPGPQAGHTGGEMCLWTSLDNGATWTMKRQITRGSPLNNSYARRPLNARDPFFAFWADGDPNTLSPSRLYFSDSKGEAVYRLPYDMAGDFATPEKVN